MTALSKLISDSGFTGEARFSEPLSKHTYYRIGGPADALVVPKSVEDLRSLGRVLRSGAIPWFVLGAGSNLLVADEGFRGLVIKSSRLNLDLASSAPGRVLAGGSVAISTFLRRASTEGWGGLEFLSGVPGSVGGAVMMNAGTHLGETKDRIRRVHAFDFGAPDGAGLREYSGAELKFEYRRNLFLPTGALVYATEWEIEPRDPVAVKSMIDETLARRKATQPIDYPSCGSVFKNPKSSGLHAWQVMDKLGLRGHRQGDAEFSQKHCNFIINHGAARATDVRALIQLAKVRALSELGVVLEEEVKYLGF